MEIIALLALGLSNWLGSPTRLLFDLDLRGFHSGIARPALW